MMEKFKLLAGVGPVLFGALLCPRAVAQLRSDLIVSARSVKEANLTPERAPKAERKIVWAEKSLAYKLLTGQVEGVGLGFGTIVPGSGFAIGPQYKRTDLWGREADAPNGGAGRHQRILSWTSGSVAAASPGRSCLSGFQYGASGYLRDALLN
jgi:hypothetical protein